MPYCIELILSLFSLLQCKFLGTGRIFCIHMCILRVSVFGLYKVDRTKLNDLKLPVIPSMAFYLFYFGTEPCCSLLCPSFV